MSAVAIITARGGSKRIPGKNKKDFLGKPIICYSIEAALESGIFDEVMVSTDDEEIAEIARNAGASVPLCEVKKQRMILLQRMMCFWKYWKNMKNVGRYLIIWLAYIRPHRL